MRHAVLATCFGLLLGVSSSAFATQTLAYFDTSSSTQSFHQGYVQDFAKYVETTAKTGDGFLLMRIGLETQHFAPFGTYVIEAAPKGISPAKKKQFEQDSKDAVVMSVPAALKQPVKYDATNIIGALVSAGDYFRQKNIPPQDRVIILFTDGIEQSGVNKINMAKGIPKKLPATVKLPEDLNARVLMIGVYPPNKPGAQEALRGFWQQVIEKTGSKLEMFLQRYP